MFNNARPKETFKQQHSKCRDIYQRFDVGTQSNCCFKLVYHQHWRMCTQSRLPQCPTPKRLFSLDRSVAASLLLSRYSHYSAVIYIYIYIYRSNFFCYLLFCYRNARESSQAAQSIFPSLSHLKSPWFSGLLEQNDDSSYSTRCLLCRIAMKNIEWKWL